MDKLCTLPLHSNMYLAMMHAMKEALHECCPLQRKGCNEEVKANAAEAIALQERHEEPKANENHHVYILET